MNLENIRKVRDAIAKLQSHPEKFRMISWIDYIDDSEVDYDTFDATNDATLISNIREGDCNTCACIGGWAVAVLADKETTNVRHYGFMTRASELLGLTDEEAQKLFTPWDCMVEHISPLAGDPMKAGPKEAVKVLTHILEINEIDWNAAWR